MKIVYYIWAVVPLSLIFIAVRGFYKYRLRKGVRDDYGFSFVQGIYSALILGVAILCDLYVFDPMMENYEVQAKVANITRFLVYPVVLLIASGIQGIYGKRKDKNTVKRKYY